VDELVIEDYDGLLLTGEMDCKPLMTEEKYAEFVKKFDEPEIIIGSISSSTALLAKLGMLRDRKYMSGIPEEFLEQLASKGKTMFPMPNLSRTAILSQPWALDSLNLESNSERPWVWISTQVGTKVNL
jgi:putative intracellular protease/amidase